MAGVLSRGIKRNKTTPSTPDFIGLLKWNTARERNIEFEYWKYFLLVQETALSVFIQMQVLLTGLKHLQVIFLST